ncbi:AhpC/TSA family protein [Mucilaginibacter terrigena]|uniref:AhpC/TSA family protein n=1 Tax=Mucilaginibacter terrigena TaxID=2492395 RepID=A0A4Q5LKW8_9SPHI|nr:TlpA disulfide reductase family protein [Mucilaginibacter terrigena]RYU89292.1 AhpC/TSA family protein [Mucilaginibacter terrigena]
MKKFLFAIAAFLPALAFAQNAQQYTVKTRLSTIKGPAKAYLVYYIGANNIIDSADVVNGEFSFEGVVMEPLTASLFIDHNNMGLKKYIDQNFTAAGPSKSVDGLGFYLEKGNTTITGKDSITSAVITGSPTNDDDKALRALVKTVVDKAKTIAGDAQKATVDQQRSAAFQNAIQARYIALQKEQKELLKNFIAKHPGSIVSLAALSNTAGPAPSAADIEPLFNQLSAEVKNSEGGMQIKAAIDRLKITDLGSTAPDFSQNDVNGLPVQLSSLRGKYVLVDFWASWCGPCRQESPNKVKLYNKYKGKNFTVLGVSLDQNKASWLAAIKSDGLAWTQISDLKGWGNLAARLYDVYSIPQSFLIDPQGKIVAKGLRGDELDQKLEELLGKI